MRLSHFQAPNAAWEPLQQLQGEMNRLLERWGGNGGWNRAFAPAFPAVNVWEDDNAVCVEAELPGLHLEDLEIYVTGGNQLSIKGERKQTLPPKGLWHRQERGTGGFTRTLTLPYAVDPNQVDARFENGVLQVRLGKHENAKPRKIIVKGE
jgi:HSP20 family protein